MIKIDSEEQAATVTDDQLPDINFQHLLKTYQDIEFELIPNSLFVVLMCLMDLKKSERSFSLSWIIENVGSPNYCFFNDSQENGDLFYILTGNEQVGHLRIRQNIFAGFGVVDNDHFETVCLPLDTWHEAVERLRPKH